MFGSNGGGFGSSGGGGLPNQSINQQQQQQQQQQFGTNNAFQQPQPQQLPNASPFGTSSMNTNTNNNNNNTNNNNNQFGSFGANLNSFQASSTSNFGAPSPFANATTAAAAASTNSTSANASASASASTINTGGVNNAFGTSNNLALNNTYNNNGNNTFGSSFGNAAAGSNNNNNNNNPNSAPAFGTGTGTGTGLGGFQQQQHIAPAVANTIASPFGTSTTLASPFGQGQGFHNTTTTTPANTSTNASTNANNNTTAPPTTTTFGTSSNMAMAMAIAPSPATGPAHVPGFRSSTSPAPITGPTTGFGMSSMSSPFGISSMNTNNNNNNNNNATATSSNNPFGGGAPAASFASPFGSGNQNHAANYNVNANDNANANEEHQHQHAVPANNEWVNPNSKRNGPNTNANSNANANAAAEEKLANLKARIEAKKKKFLEMQVAKANGEGVMSSNVNVNVNANVNASANVNANASANMNVNASANTNASSALNPNATSFASVRFGQHSNDTSGGGDEGGDAGTGTGTGTGMVTNVNNANQALRNRIPKKKNHGKKPSKQPQQQPQQQQQQPPPSNLDDDDESDRNAQLAARNAQRFAQVQKRDTLSMLPKELQQLARDYHPSQSSNSNNRDDNANNNDNDSDEHGNLIGMCMHMCPDEELVRRESEGDVQMLEMPLVGIHPQGWTLRDTAVKRFRRSAADFKLDIPELIRPPLVLERVCGYLEEWIMERDRQGIDPRFGVGGSGVVPPPLDVYQFIWDRTRMVRKDFILQNFIGTGGNCSAVAVRCHERIARWHALCEHQLSHLNDFIRQQSQQNIQELGATMKSLNLYYDDAAGRATIEDGDAPASSSSSGQVHVHGCQSSIVMGKSPKDYNGESLMNASESVNPSNRIIGNATGGSGTAEPEMRGLYILLTINNDGGMEVLKYAARLSRDRPEIFNSKPVQLAMQVYKARREYNYARFFSLLRSASTPYLFACIMFKYVETMRKAAFQIMSKTFGTKRKDTGEGVYDHYSLKDLVHLLCFEDLDEAKAACEHYNITVKSMKIGENPDEFKDFVFWRNTSFAEPRDPEKGNILILKPKKMDRVIESKLGGATRLAICRGEVSGSGASLDSAISPENAKRMEEMAAQREALVMKRKLMLQETKRNELKMKLKMAKIKQEKERQASAEQERHEKVGREKAAEEAARRRQAELLLQKRKDEEEARTKEEDLRLAHEKTVQEGRLRKAEEERLRLERLEEEKKLLKAEEEERQRQLEAKKVQEEREHQQRLQREAEEKLRQRREAERLRLVEIERQRQKELEMKRKEKEAEERRIELEWQSKIAFARKLLTLNRWSAKMSSVRDHREETKASIECFDPFKFSGIDIRSASSHNVLLVQNDPVSTLQVAPTHESMLYRLATDSRTPLPFNEILYDTMAAARTFRLISQTKLKAGMSKNIILFRIGVFVVGDNVMDDTKDLIRMWIDNRLQLDRVHSLNVGANEVRTVCSFYNSTSIASQECDGLLVVAAPGTSMAEGILPSLEGTLIAILQFDTVTEPRDFDQILLNGCKNLASSCAQTFESPSSNDRLFMVEKFSLRWLYCTVLRRTLCSFGVDVENVRQLPSQMQRSELHGSIDRLVIHCIELLIYLVDNMRSLSNDTMWRANEFMVEHEVLNYFDEGDGLPMNWRASTEISRLQEAMWDIFPSLKLDNPEFEDLLRDFVEDAPNDVQDDCGTLFNANKFVECLDVGLQWQQNKDASREYHVYLPVGGACALIDYYLDQTMAPKTVVAKKVKRISEYEYDYSEPLLVGDVDADADVDANFEEHSAEDAIENMVPNRLDLDEDVDTRPRSSIKRSIHTDAASKESLDRKKSKIASEELQKSRIFTETLKTISDDNAGLGIVNDPTFAKLIAGDPALQKLMQM